MRISLVQMNSRAEARGENAGQKGNWRMSGTSMVIAPRVKIAIEATGTDEEILTSTFSAIAGRNSILQSEL